jgi:hypothetical protein
MGSCGGDHPLQDARRARPGIWLRHQHWQQGATRAGHSFRSPSQLYFGLWWFCRRNKAAIHENVFAFCTPQCPQCGVAVTKQFLYGSFPLYLSPESSLLHSLIKIKTIATKLSKINQSVYDQVIVVSNCLFSLVLGRNFRGPRRQSTHAFHRPSIERLGTSFIDAERIHHRPRRIDPRPSRGTSEDRSCPPPSHPSRRRRSRRRTWETRFPPRRISGAPSLPPAGGAPRITLDDPVR